MIGLLARDDRKSDHRAFCAEKVALNSAGPCDTTDDLLGGAVCPGLDVRDCPPIGAGSMGTVEGKALDQPDPSSDRRTAGGIRSDCP